MLCIEQTLFSITWNRDLCRMYIKTYVWNIPQLNKALKRQGHILTTDTVDATNFNL